MLTPHTRRGFLVHISSSAAVIYPESHNSPKTGIFIFIVQQGSWAGARRVAVWGARPGNKATLGSGPSTTLPPPPPCVSRRCRLLRSHQPECRRTWEGLQPGLGRPAGGPAVGSCSRGLFSAAADSRPLLAPPGAPET